MQRALPHFAQPAVAGRPSTVNCTWEHVQQPLDHFGENSVGNFSQRVCVFSQYWNDTNLSSPPIFFYTGNESPVDEYVNQTGLMWQLGEKLGALLVFAEHRYEPSSHPEFCGTLAAEDCAAYCTTAQALADYAGVITLLRQRSSAAARAPVIAFGGSYGGMLAGWFRIRYPHVVAGSIAGSAPVWGLARSLTDARLDWSARAIARGVSAAGGATDRCAANLRAAWPIIGEVARTAAGRKLLAKASRSCQPSVSAKELSSWGQAPWFYLAEGNFPFPSTYITFAVGPGDVPLPAWPMRAACSAGGARGLGGDHGVQLEGSVEAVQYSLRLGPLSVNVSWDDAVGNGDTLTPAQLEASGAFGLVRAMADGAAVWYNVTHDLPCFDIQGGAAQAGRSEGEQPRQEAETAAVAETARPRRAAGASARHCPSCPPCDDCPPCPQSRCPSEPRACNFTGSVPNTFSWDGVTCNDDLWLYNNAVQGAGHDIFWPPSHARHATVEDVVGPHTLKKGCGALLPGLVGAPVTSDPWSPWLAAYYDGSNLTGHRNIIWSNGLLDPWSGGGVYPAGGGIDGPMVQNISADGSQLALLIKDGAHHLDLMWAGPADPPSVRAARAVEEHWIGEWCREWTAAATAAAA